MNLGFFFIKKFLNFLIILLNKKLNNIFNSFTYNINYILLIESYLKTKSFNVKNPILLQ
jgi:hypothetical protein